MWRRRGGGGGGGRWFRAAGTERSEVTVGTAAVDDRRGIAASFLGRFSILKSNLNFNKFAKKNIKPQHPSDSTTKCGSYNTI